MITGIADLARDAHDFLRIVGQRALGAGHAREPSLDHRRFGAHLVAHQADRFRPRADEHEARALDLLGEVGVLGEEAVAGMDRLGIGDLGGADDRRDVEVARRRWRRADAHRLVGELHVLGLGTASECTATVRMPSSRQARRIRSAISPRLAMRIFSNICD